MTDKVHVNERLVYVGKIIELQPIENANFIISATVVCGAGGKWRGVVRKDQFQVGDLCVVFLPDAKVPPSDQMAFLKNAGWRVKMQRFRGAPSEVVIMPIEPAISDYPIGYDLTELYGVTKYFKEIPSNMEGKMKGPWPAFLPKTDEPNYQIVPNLIKALEDKPYYVTEKADGASTTAYRYKGNFGVCSRNLELIKCPDVGYWKIAIQHELEDKLPDGMALQWETCGPKIQGNKMGLKEISGFAFSGYNITESRYLTHVEFMELTDSLDFPIVRILDVGYLFSSQGIELLGEGLYANKAQREGVVVRSTTNIQGHCPISFKVINLNYET